jgi:hypothetical protein
LVGVEVSGKVSAQPANEIIPINCFFLPLEAQASFTRRERHLIDYGTGQNLFIDQTSQRDSFVILKNIFGIVTS